MPSDYHCSMRLSQGVSTMADIPIALTCADYARLAPLMTGDVRPDGIGLTLIHGTRGSWPARAEVLRRALQDPDVAGGEASMAAPPRGRRKRGPRPRGVPGVSRRHFSARHLY